ncbi:hypothetical protein VNO77_12338 [Canavalia gladiata]|uniref:Phytosulfokine n=1 Tax=Canavalia gladiata TaxID=3824 RepID=A0AAN9QMS1_CANGL
MCVKYGTLLLRIQRVREIVFVDSLRIKREREKRRTWKYLVVGSFRKRRMKMSSKISATLCLAVFFLFFLTFTYAGRHGPASSPFIISSKTQHGVLEEDKVVDVEETCDGIGEEECLMRRTLVAHTDYIYTQKHKP